MKVLWFTNTPCGSVRRSNNNSVFGGWLISLEDEIKKHPEFSLEVAFFSKINEKSFIFDGVRYYPICTSNMSNPINRLKNRWKSLKKKDEERLPYLIDIVNTSKPDIIHIHGTEESFGMICPYAKELHIPVVFSIQGVISSIKNLYFRGIPMYDAYKLDSLRDKLHLDGIRANYKYFCKRAERERLFLRDADYIFGRTFFDRECTLAINPHRNYMMLNEIMRPVFYEKKWKGLKIEDYKLPTTVKILTTISSGLFKGLETILETASILKDYSGLNFEWKLVGYNPSSKFVRISEKTTKVNPADVNVVFCGRLGEDVLSDMLTDTDIYVHVSHIENSPNSVCEAMLVGVPTIASYAGGTASILKDDVEGKLYQDGDPLVLAGIILDYINNPSKMRYYANNARKTALERHNPARVAEELCNGYRCILQFIKDKYNVKQEDLKK